MKAKKVYEHFFTEFYKNIWSIQKKAVPLHADFG